MLPLGPTEVLWEKAEYVPVECSIAPDPNLRMKWMIGIGQSAGNWR